MKSTILAVERFEALLQGWIGGDVRKGSGGGQPHQRPRRVIAGCPMVPRRLDRRGHRVGESKPLASGF